MIFALFGILSGLLVIIGDIPYIIDSIKRKTTPHRVTWFIVFLLNVIAFANQSASGATDSLGLVIGGIIATFSVFLVSIWRGTGGYSRLDIMSLIGAGIGLILWYIFNTPLASIIANIVVATIALVPTYRKTYLDPASETKITWLIGAISAFFGCLAVGSFNVVLLLLPFYSFVVQLGLYILMNVREKQLGLR